MKLSLLITALFYFNITFSQNVGIGTTNPLARLHVTDSSVLFSATYGLTSGSPPVEGPGKRIRYLETHLKNK